MFDKLVLAIEEMDMDAIQSIYSNLNGIVQPVTLEDISILQKRMRTHLLHPKDAQETQSLILDLIQKQLEYDLQAISSNS